jgi:chromosome segregation ATPase
MSPEMSGALIGLIGAAVTLLGALAVFVRANAKVKESEAQTQATLNEAFAAERLERMRLQGQIDEQRKQQLEISIRLVRAEDNATTSKADLAALRTKLEETDAALQRAREEGANRQSEIERLQRVIGDMNIKVSNLQRELETERTTNKTLRAEKTALLKELSEVKSRLTTLEGEWQETRERVKTGDTGELPTVTPIDTTPSDKTSTDEAA